MSSVAFQQKSLAGRLISEEYVDLATKPARQPAARELAQNCLAAVLSSATEAPVRWPLIHLLALRHKSPPSGLGADRHIIANGPTSYTLTSSDFGLSALFYIGSFAAAY